MKTLIVILVLIAWIGCKDEVTTPGHDVLEADARWTNMLASDGCSWHFYVESTDTSYYFVPDDASIATIEKNIGKMEGSYSFTDVHIKYSLTGAKKEVQCGWGARPKFDEIRVSEITKRKP